MRANDVGMKTTARNEYSNIYSRHRSERSVSLQLLLRDIHADADMRCCFFHRLLLFVCAFCVRISLSLCQSLCIVAAEEKKQIPHHITPSTCVHTRMSCSLNVALSVYVGREWEETEGCSTSVQNMQDCTVHTAHTVSRWITCNYQNDCLHLITQCFSAPTNQINIPWLYLRIDAAAKHKPEHLRVYNVSPNWKQQVSVHAPHERCTLHYLRPKWLIQLKTANEIESETTRAPQWKSLHPINQNAWYVWHLNIKS